MDRLTKPLTKPHLILSRLHKHEPGCRWFCASPSIGHGFVPHGAWGATPRRAYEKATGCLLDDDWAVSQQDKPILTD